MDLRAQARQGPASTKVQSFVHVPDQRTEAGQSQRKVAPQELQRSLPVEPMSGWIPVFTLPNVFVKDPIEVEYVALVSPDDARCIEIGKTNKNFLRFLRSFTDAFKRQVIPSVVLLRKDAPQWVMSMEAIGAFRDAISISAVVH